MLLGPFFIDCYIRDKFHGGCKVVPWHSRLRSIPSSLQMEYMLLLDISVLNMKSTDAARSNDVDEDDEKEESHLGHVSRQTKIPPFRQAAVRFRWQVKTSCS